MPSSLASGSASIIVNDHSCMLKAEVLASMVVIARAFPALIAVPSLRVCAIRVLF